MQFGIRSSLAPRWLLLIEAALCGVLSSPAFTAEEPLCEVCDPLARPAWAETLVISRSPEKSKELYKEGAPATKALDRRKDLNYDQIDTPLIDRDTGLRVRRDVRLPQPPFRSEIPDRGMKTARIPLAEPDGAAEVIPPALLSQGMRTARQTLRLSDGAPADRVDLQVPQDTVLTPRDEVRSDPSLAARSENLSDVPRDPRADIPAGVRDPMDAEGIPLRARTSADERPARGFTRTTVPAAVLNEFTPDDPDRPRMLSRIERLYNSTPGLSHGKRLEQFGYRAFAAPPTRLDSTAQIDPEFVLGPGDEIRVKSVDGFVYDKVLTVERDGTIFVEEIGSIRVAGLKASELNEALRTAIARTKHDFRLDVSLGRLHSIRIFVYGYVRNQGLQVVPANSTLMDALSAVGGPTKDGTLRDIVISRPGQNELHVDLYNLLVPGRGAGDIVLLSGDTVSVGAIGATAGVIGPVGSGIYELAGKTTVQELVQFAGRINAFTQLNNVQLERSYDNRRREIQTLDFGKDAPRITVQDGDVVSLSQLDGQLNNTVAIVGAVMHPGVFPYREGMRVSDLIRMAGNFVLDSSLDRALILRPLGNRRDFDNMPGDKLGHSREEAIWVDLAALVAHNPNADTPLNRLDTLRIFTQSEAQATPTVKISGEVRKPGTYKLTSGMTLGDLVHLAGGPTPDAFAGESSIARRKRTNGDMHMDIEIIPFRLEDVMHRTGDYDFLLQNQDQVMVKRVHSMQVTVRVWGRVQFPGTHILPDGAKISDALADAGGLLPDADLRAAVFTRRRIQALQQARLDDLVTRMEDMFGDRRNAVIRDGRNNEGIAAHLAYLGLRQYTSSIERFQARGRLVINMLCAGFLESHDNMVLEDGDELYIPRRENIVMVMGEANYPNAFVWQNGMTVEEYLYKAGGLMPDADKKQIYVVMANGEVRSDSNKRLFGESVAGFRPGPGDTILVPKQAPKRSSLAKASDITLLIRQIAESGLVGATIPQALNQNSPAQVNIGLGNSIQSPPDIINNQAPEQFYNDTRERANRLDTGN